MGLPIHLNHRPVVWHTNPLVVPIRCWRDRAKTRGVDLTLFGSSWTANVRPDNFTATPVMQFEVDDSGAVGGALTLTLEGTAVSTLSRPYYVYDVVADGGSVSPLTVFLGSFSVQVGI